MSTFQSSGGVDGNLYARVHKSSASSSSRREASSNTSHHHTVVNGNRSINGPTPYSRDSGISSASSHLVGSGQRKQDMALTATKINQKQNLDDQSQLDEIISELLGDQLFSTSPTTPPRSSSKNLNLPPSGTITTNSGNTRTILSWESSQAGPKKSTAIAKQSKTVAPNLHSESSQSYKKEFSQQGDPNLGFNYSTSSQSQSQKNYQTSSSSNYNANVSGGGRHESIMSPLGSPPPARLYSVPWKVDTAYDNQDLSMDYSSDSELSWLQQQQMKLRAKREGKDRFHRTEQEKRLVHELKSAQNVFTHKKSISEAEEAAFLDKYASDIITNGPSTTTSYQRSPSPEKPPPRPKTPESYRTRTEHTVYRSKTPEPYKPPRIPDAYRTKTPEPYRSRTVVESYRSKTPDPLKKESQYKQESFVFRTTSPKPTRKEFHTPQPIRRTMSHQEGSHSEKTYFVSGLERPPFTTHQTKYVFSVSPPKYSQARITDEVDRSIAETSFQSFSYEEPEPEPEEIIEEEVISLRPVGAGMHVLEPERPPDSGRMTPGFPVGGVGAVATTPPFPTSSRTQYVNQGQPRVVQQTQYHQQHSVSNVQQSYSSSGAGQTQVPPHMQAMGNQQQVPAIGPPPGMQPGPPMNGPMSNDMGTLQSGSTGTLQSGASINSGTGTLQSGSTLQGGTMQGGAMQGGMMHGGAMQGTAMQGGAMQGGMMHGGAMQGTAMQGTAMQGGSMQGTAMQGAMQPMMQPPMMQQQTPPMMQQTSPMMPPTPPVGGNQNMANTYSTVHHTTGQQPLQGGGMSQYEMDKKVQSQQNYNVSQGPAMAPGQTMTQQYNQHNQQQQYSYSSSSGGGGQKAPISSPMQQGGALAAHQQAIGYNLDSPDTGRGQQHPGFQQVPPGGMGGQHGMASMGGMQGMQTGGSMHSTEMHSSSSQQRAAVNGGSPPHQALHVDTSQRMLSAPSISSTATGSQISPQSPTSTLRSQQSTMTQQSGLTTPNAMSSMTGQSSPYFGQSHHGSFSSLDSMETSSHTPKFVRDTSKYWYKPHISREEAITYLKDRDPGTFIVRDSNSFPGAFGLALKVAHIPPNVSTKAGDPTGSELVRHFLIETTPKGVKLRGCSNEPVFGSLAALVYQHSITPLALPCKLKLPDGDSLDNAQLPSSAAQLLAQGAACNVVFLNTVDTESLTGPEAVAKAVKDTFTNSALKNTTVHFKVSSQGITLTDTKRRLFFRRHYPVATVTYCGMDPEDRRWSRPNDDTGIPMNAKVFGFVARKQGGSADNACHLFAELDVEQPATAIVNFITKVMLSQGRGVKS